MMNSLTAVTSRAPEESRHNIEEMNQTGPSMRFTDSTFRLPFQRRFVRFQRKRNELAFRIARLLDSSRGISG